MVYDVRTGAYAEEDLVELPNLVVTSPDSGSGFFVQDQSGSEYAGIWVYYGGVSAFGETGAGVALGDAVTISGQYIEYYELSEIEILDAAGISVTGTGSVPSPVTLTDADLGDAATAEKYESMLVTVESVAVSADRGSGEWLWGSNVITHDKFFDAEELGLLIGSTAESITGNLNYNFSEYKLEPHDSGSFVNLAAPVCAADLCAADLTAGDLVVSEIMFNPSGTAGSDDYNEWVEFYNTTRSSIDLQGLTFEDDGGNNTVIVSSVIVASGGYVVLAKSDGTSWGYGFTPDYYWGTQPTFGNSGDYAYLYYTDGSTTTDIDMSADYDAAGAGGAGTSAQLDSAQLTSTGSSTESYWCNSASDFDSTGDLGTPGSANTSCR
jgi:hypothetical protein